MTAPPDLDVSQPTTADIATARDQSRFYDQAARELGKHIDELRSNVKGAGADTELAKLYSARSEFDASASHFALLASVMADCRAAGDRWLKDAPKHAELDAADKALADAKAKLAAVPDGEPTAELRAKMQAAQRTVDRLYDERQKADEAYESAVARAKAKLGDGDGNVNERNEGHSAPGAAGQTKKDGPGSSSPTPSPTAASPGAPRSAPAASPSATSKGASDLNSDALKALGGQQLQPQQMAAPQAASHAAPQAPHPAAPAAPQAGKRDRDGDDRRDGALRGLEDLLPAAALVPAAAEQPRSAAAHAPAPAHAPANALAPASATNSTGGTGTSAVNLSTASNTTGRNVPLAGAYDPSTSTSASQAGTGTAATPEAVQRAAGQPQGMPPGMPLGGMPTGGSGGGGSAREPVKRHREGSVTPGQEALDDAIPGGTILQRRTEDGGF